MAPLKELQPQDVEVLHEWLKSIGMPVNRQFNRDYADGVLVAKILKQLYPRYVDLHNYQARFSQELKVVNWQMLHFKILSKIGLPLTREVMTTLARGDTNTIERLLWAIMNTIHTYPKELKESDKALITRKPSNTVSIRSKKSTASVQPTPPKQGGVNTPPQIDSQPPSKIELSNKPSQIVDIMEEAMIPYAMYEGAINEIHSKDKTIKKFETKVAFLENLLKEKDAEIDGLKKKPSEGLLAI